jgi:hypothetical protein
MQFVSALWWPSNHDRCEAVRTPDAARELARAAGEAVTDGRLDLESTDVGPDDVGAVAPWVGLIGIEDAAEPFLSTALFHPSDVAIADSSGEGESTSSVVVPFTRFDTADARMALTVRRLCVLISDTVVLRLWGPSTVVGAADTAVEPSTIGHEGTDTLQTIADPVTQDAFPSALRRQRDVPPLDALVDEVEAAQVLVREWRGASRVVGALLR